MDRRLPQRVQISALVPAHVNARYTSRAVMNVKGVPAKTQILAGSDGGDPLLMYDGDPCAALVRGGIFGFPSPHQQPTPGSEERPPSFRACAGEGKRFDNQF